MLENELNRAAFEVKERKFALDLLDCTRWQLLTVVSQSMHCGVLADGQQTNHKFLGAFARHSKW